MSGIRYRPEIDGLRAVAVIAVILFHLGYKWIPGGYLGVDVFFVISGYLITSIILRELTAGTFSFKDFWARRVRRIMPALLAVIIVTMAITSFAGIRDGRKSVGEQALATLLSGSNIYFWRFMGDYWGPKAEESPFLHTWSLAVEEQFYLFLPLLLVAVYKLWPKRVLSTLGVCVFFSLALFMICYDWKPMAAFYLLPTRAWELGAGCILAAVHHRLPSATDKLPALGLLGLGMILLGYLFVPVLSPGVLIPVLGATLLIAFGQQGLCGRLLSAWPVVGIGKISYSLYLWHWPLIVLPKQFGYELSLLPYLTLTYLAALGSYYFIERSTRNAKWTVPAAISGLAVTSVLAFVMTQADQHYNFDRFNTIVYHNMRFDLRPQQAKSRIKAGELTNVMRSKREDPANAQLYLDSGIVNQPGSVPQVVLYGDSHGGMWCNTLMTAANEHDWAVSLCCMEGVPPFFTNDPNDNSNHREVDSETLVAFNRKKYENLLNWRPKVAIVVTRWSTTTPLEHGAIGKEFIALLAQHADQVLLIGQPPELAFGQRLAADQLCYLGIDPNANPEYYLPAGREEEVASGEAFAKSLADAHSNVNYVDISDLFLSDDQVLVLRGKDVVYWDDDHLTEFGVSLARERVEQAIHKALAP